MSDFPVTKRTDVLPSENSFPKKSIGKDWGGEDEAANPPNTPTMGFAKHKTSTNLICDYDQEINENEFLTD